MSEPTADSNSATPITPAPFGPGERQPVAGSGCGRAGLVGCGIVILLLGIAAVVLVMKADDFLGWAMKQMETEILANLPEDCTEEEVQRLQEAFASAIAVLQEGEVDPAALQEFVSAFGRLEPDASGSLSREQIQELTLLLERIAGVAPEDSAQDRRLPVVLTAVAGI